MKTILICLHNPSDFYPLVQDSAPVLLPVYDRPYLQVVLEQLGQAGLRDILLVHNHPEISRFLQESLDFRDIQTQFLHEATFDPVTILQSQQSFWKGSPFVYYDAMHMLLGSDMVASLKKAHENESPFCFCYPAPPHERRSDFYVQSREKNLYLMHKPFGQDVYAVCSVMGFGADFGDRLETFGKNVDLCDILLSYQREGDLTIHALNPEHTFWKPLQNPNDLLTAGQWMRTFGF